MPETNIKIEWPDGEQQNCYSNQFTKLPHYLIFIKTLDLNIIRPGSIKHSLHEQ